MQQYLGKCMYKSFKFYYCLFQNRFFVQSKLKKDLNEELRLLFREHTADKHIAHLLCEW